MSRFLMSNLLLYVATVLIWGSTFFAIEYQLGVVEPEVSIFYRYAMASMLLFGWSMSPGLRLRFETGAGFSPEPLADSAVSLENRTS